MARDILSTPVTTVASESTFSAGSRVIDKKRASMRVDTEDVSLCAGDRIKEAYGVRSEKHVSFYLQLFQVILLSLKSSG